MNWMIYALGGGWGHLTRALALARQIARVSSPPRPVLHLLTNSRLADYLRRDNCRSLVDLPTDLHWHAIPPDANREAVIEAVHRTLASLPIETLIVDTFPRGLAGELEAWLPGFDGRKVLIHRALKDDYLRSMNVASTARQYDLLLVPGESAAYDDWPTAVTTAPWLIADSGDLLSRPAAQQFLGLNGSKLPVVGCLACGKPDEVRQLTVLGGMLAQHLEGKFSVRVIAPPEPTVCDGLDARTVSCWPALCLHAGMDLLVGGGGYNTVHETRATGLPLLAIPRPRMYDQQRLRLSDGECLPGDCSIETLIEACRRASLTAPTRKTAWSNGARTAAQLLLNGNS